MTGRVPEGVALRDAAVLPTCLCTAAVGLCDRANLRIPHSDYAGQGRGAESRGDGEEL